MIAVNLDALLNLVLIICAGVFIVAAVLRIIGRRGGSGEQEEGAPPEKWGERRVEEQAEESPAREEPRSDVSYSAEPGGIAQAPLREMPTKELFSRVVEEDPDRLRMVAESLVEHSISRGGLSHVPRHKLDKLALQFALLDMAMKRASYVSSRGLHTIPGDTMSEILREGFRLVASQDRG